MALRESASPEPPLSAACDSIAHRIDLMSGLVAAHVLRAAGDDIDGVLRASAARRRAEGAGLVIAPLPVAALADPDALDAAAKARGVDPRALGWEIDAASLDRAALDGATRLRARGWALGLRTSAGEASPLAARDRALFSNVVVTGIWSEACACPALQTRLRAAQAIGASVVWAGTLAPKDARMLVAEGYDVVERAGRPAPQLAMARAPAEQASSFSSR